MVSTEVAAFSGVPILLFEVGGRRYGLRAADVRELVRAVTIYPLPKAPAIVEGLVNVRGRIVPVLDIRSRFRIPLRPLAPSDHLILAQAGTRLVAIRVDRAVDLLRVEEGQLQATGEIVPDGECVAGVAKLSDGLALIHDLRTFLDEAEGLALDDALRSGTGTDA